MRSTTRSSSARTRCRAAPRKDELASASDDAPLRLIVDNELALVARKLRMVGIDAAIADAVFSATSRRCRHGRARAGTSTGWTNGA